jgi:hypothetical protein
MRPGPGCPAHHDPTLRLLTGLRQSPEESGVRLPDRIEQARSHAIQDGDAPARPHD